VPCEEDPLQRGRRDALEDPPDRAPAGDVPGAPLGDVDQVDAERLGDPLALAWAEYGGHTDDAGGAIDAPELGGPPPARGLKQAALIVARRLACPGTSVRGVRGGLEGGDRVLEGLAAGSDRSDRLGSIRHVAVRVEREGDVVDPAPDDGEREPRPGLPFAPVIPDDRASDTRLGVDAAIGDDGDERVVLRPIRRGDERPGCRWTGLEVREQRR